jgi:hypothetical protein
MAARAIERIGADERLEPAVERAFERIRSADAAHAALVFDVAWQPTMELVEVLVRALGDADEVRTLTLVHPSAAMTFIASAVGIRCTSVQLKTQRSVYDDDDEDEITDATASRTMFKMEDDERVDVFVRRSVTEARTRLVRRFALIFSEKAQLSPDLADVLAEELLHSGAKEIGLVHGSDVLETVADTLRLRLPDVRVALATQRKGAGSS